MRHERIAVPLFEGDVAPRFCFADRLRIVDVEDGTEIARREESMGETWFPGRLARLHDLRVSVLLCAGFNRDFLGQAQELGVRVVSGLVGDADAVLRAWLSGRPETVRGPGGRGRRCRAGGGGRRGRGESAR